MGRTRKTDKHLPARVYLEHGAYYFRPKDGGRIRLSDSLPAALTEYARLIGADWTGRTLGDVIDRYRVEVLPLKRSSKTRDDEGRSLDRLKIAFGRMLPDTVTPQDLYLYMDKRRSKDGRRVPVAARHEVILLGHVFKHGIKWGIGTKNVASKLLHEKGPGKHRKVMPDWVEGVRALATPRMLLAIDWAIMIGQRRGDLLKLRFSDLRDDGVYVQQGKTGAQLLLTYTPAVHALIARSKAMPPHIPREYLIRQRSGQPYTAAGFNTNWQRLIKKHVKAGGEHFQFKHLRSVSANKADTVEEASARLGHASISTTKRFYWDEATKVKPSA